MPGPRFESLDWPADLKPDILSFSFTAVHLERTETRVSWFLQREKPTIVSQRGTVPNDSLLVGVVGHKTGLGHFRVESLSSARIANGNLGEQLELRLKCFYQRFVGTGRAAKGKIDTK